VGSKQTFAIDFGSENIRMARSTQNMQAPQVLRPNLLNAVRVDRNQGATAVGDTVYDGVTSGSVILATNIFDEKLGTGAQQALNSLLQEIFRRFELDRLSVEDKVVSETVFSLPIGFSRNDSKFVASRLLENGFPAPRAYPAARAVFLSYFQEKKLQPGSYLVLDCGALHTRMAICTIDPSRRLSQFEYVSGNTGGGEIDRILTQHFSEIINDPEISRGEILGFVRQFKKGFLNKILQGSSKFVSRSPFSSGVPTFDLNLEDFERLANSYFSTFTNEVRGFLQKQGVLSSQLSGVLLAGANSQWPLVVRFAEELVGKDKAYFSEFPEEALVKGLVLSVLEVRSEGGEKPRQTLETKVQQTPHRTHPAHPQTRLPALEILLRIVPAFLEVFFGAFGILGVGWIVSNQTIFGLSWKGPWWKKLFLRLPLLLAWPLILMVFIFGLLGVSVNFSDARILMTFIPVWCIVPLASGVLVFWTSRKKN